MPAYHAFVHQPTEWAFTSSTGYGDPFHDVLLDVMIHGPNGRSWIVPSYWAGANEWRVRFAAPVEGTYVFHSTCSDKGNTDLHGVEGTIEAHPCEGTNALLRHGPLRTSADGRTLEHKDGTPFFWLGDIWWLGMTRRLSWPDGFQRLAADRASKGFTTILLCAGLPCDMPAFDPRSTNEAGFPWERDFARINPSFFDMADLRIQWLVRSGLVPCIVGAWSFYLEWMGIERLKAHWRYLIARWGAYPVIWCLGGTVPMPWYLDPDRATKMPRLRKAWGQVARYIAATDPNGHPLLSHSGPGVAPVPEEDDELLTVRTVFSGLGRPETFGRALAQVREALATEPTKPVIQIEGGFEGARADAAAQRLGFWGLTLSGMAGFTYGANGIWQFNNVDDPFGPSPWGVAMGDTPWDVAAQYPGAEQVALGKQLLERYPWTGLRSHPEWIMPHASVEDPLGPYIAGTPEKLRIAYLPRVFMPPPRGEGLTILELEPEVTYTAFWFSPRDGREVQIGRVCGETTWQVPLPPVAEDWVLVLERAS